MTNRTSTLTIAVKADTKQARSVAQALADVEKNARATAKAMAGTGATDRFVKSLSGLKLTAKDVQAVSVAWKDYARSAGLAGKASDWTKVQAAGVKAWERQTIGALRAVTREQNAYAKSVASMIASTKAAPTAWQNRRAAAMAGVGTYAAYRARGFVDRAIQSVAEFDIASRQQKVFMDLSAEQQKALRAQAVKIGQETKFTNLDVVHAQTAAMQGLGPTATPEQKARAGLGITDAASNFAQMMPGTDLTTAAELIRSYAASFGKNMEDTAEAVKHARDASNVMLKAAKAGGMSTEDLAGAIKFGGAAALAGGLSPETAMALFSMARVAGLRGDEAGVFVRSASTKLNKPTRGGLAALAAAGIRYEDYVGGGKISIDGLEAHTRRTLGQSFTPKTRARLEKALADPTVARDRGKFTQAYTGAMQGQFGVGKKGKHRAADLQRIARAGGDFHKVAQGKVNTEGLLDAIMRSNMTYAQAAEFFTSQHSGKATLTAAKWDKIVAAREALRKVQENDPEFAARGAKEIRGGVGGAVNDFKGSVETMFLQLGEANAGLIKKAAETGSALTEAFANSSVEVRQFATAVGAATAAFGVFKTGSFIKDVLTGGGAAAALTGSATALDGSAAALTAAAVKLGGGSIEKKLSKSAVAAAATGGIGWGALGALTGGTAFLIYKGMGGDMSEQEAERTKQMVELDQRIASLDSVASGKLSRGEDAGETLSKLAQARAQLADLKAKADGAKTAIEGLNTSVTPNIDVGPIDTALAKALQLRDVIRSIGRESSAIQTRLPSLTRIQRGNYTYGGIQGE